MKLARLSLILLVVAGIATGCTGSPTAAPTQVTPSSGAVFEGGGFMGNGGRTTPPDSTAASDGGGYAGNGG